MVSTKKDMFRTLGAIDWINLNRNWYKGFVMKKKDILNVFGVEISTPLIREEIEQLLDVLPQLGIDNLDSEEITVKQISQVVNDEIKKFILMLDEVDAGIFFEVVEEYSLLANSYEQNTMQPKKDKWGFYIRFQVSRPIGIDCNSLVFLDKFIIESDSGLSLKEARILRLRNLENEPYKEIAEVSRRVEQTLIFSFAELGIGIAYPDNLASAALLEKTKRAAENDFFAQHTVEHDGYFEIPLIHWSDKFGVNLFLEKSIAWDTKATQENEAVDVEIFNNFFSQHYNRFESIFVAGESYKKIKTATSILTTSLFDDSLINRIILSMTAIEVLSEKMRRPDAEIDALKYLSKKLNESEIDIQVKESINKELEKLHHQSIGKNCRILVRSLLSKKDAKLFYELYEFRSQLVHAGELKKDEKEEQTEMFNIYRKSYSLAKRLLEAYVEKLSEEESKYR